MDDLYLSENVDLSGLYSMEQAVRITEGVSLFVCALMCSSYALCSNIFYNTESEKCILIDGFYLSGERLDSGAFWHYFQPVSQYKVTITTASGGSADTDATVFLTILGSKGQTAEFKIEDRTLELFQKESIDTFMFRSVDVGEIKGMKIYRDNTGKWPGWKLASVRITKIGGSSFEIEVNQLIPTTPLHLSK